MTALRIRIKERDDGSLVMIFEDDRGVLHITPISEQEAEEHRRKEIDGEAPCPDD